MLEEIRHGRRLWIEVQKGAPGGRHADAKAVVLFVHGSCANKEQFRAQTGILQEAGIATVVYDHLGCGQSDKPRIPAAYHPDEMTDDLRAIVKHYAQGYERLYVVAHSFGTIMACRVMCEIGDQLTGMVLMGAVYPGPGHPSVKRLFHLPECILGWMQPWLTEGFLSLAFHASTMASQPELVETERHFANSNPPHMFKAFHTQVGDILKPAERFQSWVAKLTAKTLVIMGEGDKLTPVDMGAQLATAVPNGQLHIISGASHQVMQEKPEEVNKLILMLIEETIN